MAPRNSLIDNDFLDEGDFEEKASERWQPPEDQEVFAPREQKKSEEEKINVEVSDDTPEEDRGRWVAGDADGEPDLPGEEEVRGYASGARKRINQVTARMHAERRRADEIAREHVEAVNLARRLMAENNSLKDFVNQGQKVLMGEHQGRLKGVVEAAKAAYKEAHDAGDAAGMIAAQEQLASAIAKMERAAATPPMNLQREDETVFQRPLANGGQPMAPPPPDPAAVKWHEKNAWFGRDDAMTGYALGLHKEMIERRGVTPDQPEYYKTLDQEMRKRFPDRFQRNGSMERRSQTPVGAVSRTGNGSGGPRTVRITESQARLAKRLGLTLEQYAQQLVLEQNQRDSDGNRTYTHG
jgi:hypothetical protein